MKNKVILKYNPYLKETSLSINGESISEGNKLANARKGYLQAWLGKNSNWDGFPIELAKYINDDFELVFHGRMIDFKDVEYAFEQANMRDVQCNLTYVQSTLPEDTKSFQKYLEIVSELENYRFKNIPSQYLNSLHDKRVKDACSKAKNSVFDVNVVATMSSGKSTLLNAILGRELLPSKNEACTASVTRISVINNSKTYRAQCLNHAGKVVIPDKEVTDKDMDAYNENQNVYYIDVKGPVQNLRTDKVNMRLIDTPGPNNSQNEQHHDMTEHVLDDLGSSMIIYVLNATQLGINDDKNLFDAIKEVMEKKGRNMQERVIFVLNKCDELDPEDGEDLPTVISKLKEMLQVWSLDNAVIIPVTAFIGRLIRQQKNGEELTRKETKELNGFLEYLEDSSDWNLEEYADLSPSCRNKINQMLQEAKTKEDRAMIHTGIPALELAIQEYLEKYAFPMKLYDLQSVVRPIVKHTVQQAALHKAAQEDVRVINELDQKVKALEIIIEKGKSPELKKEIEKKLATIKWDSTPIVEEFRDKLKFKEQELLKPYRDKTNVELKEAIRMGNAFAQKAAEAVNEEIENLQIKSVLAMEEAGTAIFDVYDAYVKELGVKLNWEQLDIKTALQAGGAYIDNAEDMMKAYIEKHITTEDVYEKKTKYVEEEKYVHNKKKQWWMFWKPDNVKVTTSRAVEYDAKVGEKRLVNMYEANQAVMDKLASNAQASMKSQVAKIWHGVEDMKQDVKTMRMKQINERLESMKQELTSMKKELTAAVKKSNEEKEKFKKELEWLKEKEREMDQLLGIK